MCYVSTHLAIFHELKTVIFFRTAPRHLRFPGRSGLTQVLLVMTPCRLVRSCRRFGEGCCRPLHKEPTYVLTKPSHLNQFYISLQHKNLPTMNHSVSCSVKKAHRLHHTTESFARLQPASLTIPTPVLSLGVSCASL